MSATVQISVNGERVETRSSTLAALIDELGHGSNRIATALNGTFVPAGSRASTEVKAGDAIEIVSARQGG